MKGSERTPGYARNRRSEVRTEWRDCRGNEAGRGGEDLISTIDFVQFRVTVLVHKRHNRSIIVRIQVGYIEAKNPYRERDSVPHHRDKSWRCVYTDSMENITGGGSKRQTLRSDFLGCLGMSTGLENLRIILSSLLGVFLHVLAFPSPSVLIFSVAKVVYVAGVKWATPNEVRISHIIL